MSALISLIKGKCPQCRDGNVFVSKGVNLKKFRDMNETCPTCLVKFESEPGFFWGAMYFSYAYSVASFIIIGFFFFTLSDDVNIMHYILTVVVFTLITSPLSFRMSRLMMMYIASPYRKFKR
mgnify:CR=1 FL=1|jgi:hypothetical protein